MPSCLSIIPATERAKAGPISRNMRSAADGALVALAARLGVAPITLEPRLDTIGHSLGAAAALDFASRHPQMNRRTRRQGRCPACAMKRPSFVGSFLSHLLGRKLRQPCGLAPPRTKPATAARRDLSWTSGRHHSVRHGSRISGGVSRFCYLPRNSGNRSQYGGRRGGGGNPRVHG